MFVVDSSVVAFLFYAFVQGITPGPANTVSFASAMAFEARGALRQWAGLVVGFMMVSAMSLCLLLALGSVAQSVIPVISWLGAAYMVYLAAHMLKGLHEGGEAERLRPTFARGVIVQLSNAKIAVASVAAFSSYVIPYVQDPLLIGLSALVMPVVGTLCNLVWLFGGSWLSRAYAKHERAANVAMAAALVLCAASMVV